MNLVNNKSLLISQPRDIVTVKTAPRPVKNFKYNLIQCYDMQYDRTTVYTNFNA